MAFTDLARHHRVAAETQIRVIGGMVAEVHSFGGKRLDVAPTEENAVLDVQAIEDFVPEDFVQSVGVSGFANLLAATEGDWGATAMLMCR